jgi:hypothetical protein
MPSGCKGGHGRVGEGFFVVANQICEQAHNIGMDEPRVLGQEPEPIGHEQCMSHVEAGSLVNGSFSIFNNAYDMVDVKNDMMKLDVARDNEEEAIASMLDVGGGLEGWSQKHTTFEEASRVPLFKRSTFLSLSITLLIMNCCHTHGTSNNFIFELLGLFKKSILPNPNMLPSSKHEAFRTMKQLGLSYNTI